MLHIIVWSSVMCDAVLCPHVHIQQEAHNHLYLLHLRSALKAKLYKVFFSFHHSFLLHPFEDFFSLFFIAHTPPNFGLYGHKHPQAAHRKSCRENMHQDSAGGQPQGITTTLLREQGIHRYPLSQTAEISWLVADHCSSWLCIQRKNSTLPPDVGNKHPGLIKVCCRKGCFLIKTPQTPQHQVDIPDICC